MLNNSRSIIMLMVAFVATSLTVRAQQPAPKFPEGFNIQKGVNIGYWLSDASGRNGTAQVDFFGEQDVTLLAQKGFDHLRIPIEEGELWNYKNEKYADAFKYLHSAIGWCKNNKLRVIIDLQTLKGHRLWTSDDEQDRFVQIWQELAQEFKKYPANLVAYELLSSPVADSAAEWNDLLAKTIKAIREIDPKRVIVVSSNQNGSYSTFSQLKLPEGDNHIILNFHYFEPIYFTHYRYNGSRQQDYSGPVHYPGATITARELNEQPATIRNLLAGSTQDYNDDVIADQISTAAKVARKFKAPLICGEWGCTSLVPRKDRMRWYKDMKKALDKNAIPWTVWTYKGDFGIMQPDGSEDDKLLKLLTKD
ncbi:cellulase family glycosylhydrolase [Chitinophaga sp.]|uniref:glycoside hydrolase family 5 protein n=1 Tax=Chitinophaga sp. TaxID=1869181 RepID=UPI0031E26948